MGRTYPVDHQARLRLLEAQRAESQALRDVGKVARRLESLVGRLDAMDLDLAKAEYELVSVSGMPSRPAARNGAARAQAAREAGRSGCRRFHACWCWTGDRGRNVARCTFADDVTDTHQAVSLRIVRQMRGDRVAWARAQAEQFMSPLGRRWAHVQAVAARAASLPFGGADRELLVAAAYLHDIGYAPELAATGFHPLDGARHLRSLGDEDLGSAGRPPHERQA